MRFFSVSLFAVALLVSTPFAARADTELCIESSSALYQAFAQVDGSTRDALTVKLRSGTYTLGSDLVLKYRFNGSDPQSEYGKLSFSGGWNEGCTAQSKTLGATTLNGSGGQRKIDIETINNTVGIDHLSTSNIDWALSNLICYDAKDRIATLTALRALNTRVTFTFMGCYDIAVRNSYFSARADAPDDVLMGYGSYFPTGANPASFTLATSTLRGGALDLEFLPFDDTQTPDAATVQLFGNVFENDGNEVHLDGADLYASHNRYDSLSLERGVLATNVGNIAAPAQLQSSGTPQNASPVVNQGTRFVPGGLPTLDLAGNPRQIGTNPDMGAFETNVDNALYLDVTTTAASGVGSLAQAVASANAFDGRQVIRFGIPGNCPRVITLSQTLTLTDATDILGETQPGAEASTFALGYNGAPCIVLKAGSGVSNGVVFDSNQAADDLSISQLAFSGFNAALSIRSGNGHLVKGNQFGGKLGTLTLADNTTAIALGGDASEAQIGGADAAQTNYIGGASLGIVLNGGGGNRVIGNAIGDAGLTNAPNAAGILIYTDHNRLSDNWISRSTGLNVLMTGAGAHDNVFVDNIVTQAEGLGMLIDGGAHDNRVGPGNHFGGNDSDGLYLHSGSFNDLSGNTFGNNGGLAIDLGDDGVTPNDADPLIDANSTPNRNQNFPELGSATKAPGISIPVLDGTLSSTPGNYRVDVYRSATCDASGHGEGSTLLTSKTVSLDCDFLNNNQCRRPFHFLITGNVHLGDAITATATSAAGHTSEFSSCETLLEADDRIFADDFE